jgi:hypothetical protein
LLIAQKAPDETGRINRIRTLLNKHGFPLPAGTNIKVDYNMYKQGGIDGNSRTVFINPVDIKTANTHYNVPQPVLEAANVLHESVHIGQWQQMKQQGLTDAQIGQRYNANVCKYEVPAVKKANAFLRKAVPSFNQRPEDMVEYKDICRGQFNKY